MRENYTVARPYAQAAFELACEHSDLGAWSDMLRLISMVVSDPGMNLVLENPKLDSAYQSAFITDICAEQLSQSGKNFVRVLADARRLPQATAIFKMFEKLRMEHEQVVEVEVLSPYPLDDQERARIIGTMEQRFGKKINISSRIDKTLIGGTIIRTGDSVIDASVKGSLRQLVNQLAE